MSFCEHENSTVNDLAAELRLTDNAVRAHLASLERDRLVVHSGMKPGFRKPHATYALGPEAEQLFPKAYGRLVSLLMSIFSRQVKPRNLRAGMRAAGRAVADEHLRELHGKTREQRIDAALGVLKELGGAASFQGRRWEALHLRQRLSNCRRNSESSRSMSPGGIVADRINRFACERTLYSRTNALLSV